MSKFCYLIITVVQTYKSILDDRQELFYTEMQTEKIIQFRSWKRAESNFLAALLAIRSISRIRARGTRKLFMLCYEIKRIQLYSRNEGYAFLGTPEMSRHDPPNCP